MENWKEISLEAIGGGRAIDRFNFELVKVIANINDMNTDAAAIRKVTLTVKIKPTADRTSAAITYEAEAKLVGDVAGVEHLQIGRDGHGYISDMEQLALSSTVIEKAPRLIPRANEED